MILTLSGINLPLLSYPLHPLCLSKKFKLEVQYDAIPSMETDGILHHKFFSPLDFEIYFLAFDNEDCSLIDFVLQINIARNLSYFVVKIEKYISTSTKLKMSCSNLENFLNAFQVPTNCFECIVSHLICLEFLRFLPFIFSLESYGSRSH